MKGEVRALTRLDPAVRLVLLHGPDTSTAADLARGLAQRWPGTDGETIVGAETLADDPAALATAASEIPMFGGPRVVRVEGAGEDALAAVALLLDTPAASGPVVIAAGALKKGSKLVARIEASPVALAVICWPATAASTAGAVNEIAAEHGLRLARDASAALVQATGGDRGLLRQEIAKLALYVDARPDAPASAGLADLSAVVAGVADADTFALVDAVLGGNPVATGRQLIDFAAGGTSGIPLLRAVARQLFILLDIRAAVDAGVGADRAVDAVRPPLSKTARVAVVAQVARWRAAAIRVALARLLEAERAVKRSGSAGDVAVDQLLLGLARQAARG